MKLVLALVQLYRISESICSSDHSIVDFTFFFIDSAYNFAPNTWSTSHLLPITGFVHEASASYSFMFSLLFHCASLLSRFRCLYKIRLCDIDSISAANSRDGGGVYLSYLILDPHLNLLVGYMSQM